MFISFRPILQFLQPSNKLKGWLENEWGKSYYLRFVIRHLKPNITWFTIIRFIFFLFLIIAVLTWTFILLSPSNFQERKEAIQLIIQGMSAAVILAGLYFTWKGSQVAQETLKIAQENLRVAQDGKITERFSRAIDQLGNKQQLEIRLGGIHALGRIAKDSEPDHWTVMEVLAAYIRQNSSWDGSEVAEDQPSAEIVITVQTILNIFRQRNLKHERASNHYIDLGKTNLVKANLGGIYLDKANLCLSNLREASLVNAILEGIYLDGAILSHAILNNAKLEKAKCYATNFAHAYLTKTIFSDAYLVEADFSKAHLIETDFTNANLCQANFNGALFKDSTLKDTLLHEAVFVNAKLRGINLAGQDLSKINFRGANLSKANLQNANLSEANLEGTNLSEANLEGANLSGANLQRLDWLNAFQAQVDLTPTTANLQGAKLSKAVLERAILSFANLREATLTAAKLDHADLNGANLHSANIKGANLSTTYGLNPSMLEHTYKDEDTILPYYFQTDNQSD